MLSLALSACYLFSQDSCVATIGKDEANIMGDNIPDTDEPISLKFEYTDYCGNANQLSKMKINFLSRVYLLLQHQEVLHLFKCFLSTSRLVTRARVSNLHVEQKFTASDEIGTLFELLLHEGVILKFPSHEKEAPHLNLKCSSLIFKYNWLDSMNRSADDILTHDHLSSKQEDDIFALHGLQIDVESKSLENLPIIGNPVDIRVTKECIVIINKVVLCFSKNRMVGLLSIVSTIHALDLIAGSWKESDAYKIDSKDLKGWKFSISCPIFRVALSDESSTRMSCRHQEMIIEETLLDFLSQISCQPVAFLARTIDCNAIRASSPLCRHRLEAAGLDQNTANR